MKSKTLNGAFLLAASLLLSACVSGYSEFYQGASPELVAMQKGKSASATTIPTLERVGKLGDGWELVYFKRGYVSVGYASFNSGRRETDDNAVQQGQKIGADLVVVVAPRYTGTVTSSVPIDLPTTRTTTFVTPSGKGAVMTRGTSTTYVPMSVHRLDYGAVFFIRPNIRFGILTRDLNDSERQELQSNKGCSVLAVADRSPAYEADILPGDLVLEINGRPVTQENLKSEYNRYAGQEIKVLLFRKGERIEKSVRLLP